MSSGGQKNGGKELWGGLKWPENGRKTGKLPVTHGGRCRCFAGPIPARPAAVSREISRPASFGAISQGSQMVKMTQLGSTSFGEFL